jgi:hypothetical protein
MVLLNTLFTFCHCVTKMGSIFWLVFGISTGNVFPNRSSVFVLEWPKGEFVSIFIGYILDKTKKHFM